MLWHLTYLRVEVTCCAKVNGNVSGKAIVRTTSYLNSINSINDVNSKSNMIMAILMIPTRLLQVQLVIQIRQLLAPFPLN